MRTESKKWPVYQNNNVIIDLITGISYYQRRARSAIGVDTVFTLDVCLYVCMLAL